ncbi:MAG: glycosyltransferase family 4 protein [Planctomycetota bacterium]
MTILISLLNYRPGKVGGAGNYLRQLLPALAAAREDDRIVLLSYRDIADDPLWADFEQIVDPRSSVGIIAARCREAFSGFRDRRLERRIASLNPDVVFCPQQSLFPKVMPARTVLTVHAMDHVLTPRQLSPFDRIFRKALYGYSARTADRLIVPSEVGRQLLISRYSLAPERISAVHHGAPAIDPQGVRPWNPVGRPFLFYPAATWPHKNHEALLQALATLRREGGEYALVLAGQRTGRWKRIRKDIRRLGLTPDVVHLGLVSFVDVCRLYRACDAVVFPSLQELFGLPVVEAASMGARVITSRLPVYDEVGLPARWQIDYGEPEQLLGALQQPGPTVLRNGPRTWCEAAEDTLGVLRETGASPTN